MKTIFRSNIETKLLKRAGVAGVAAMIIKILQPSQTVHFIPIHKIKT